MHLSVEGAGSSSNTMWPGPRIGPRPTFIPSGILIHPSIWPKHTNVTNRQRDRTDRTTAPFRSIGQTTTSANHYSQRFAQELSTTNTIKNAYPSFRMRPGLYKTVWLSSISTTHLVPSSVSATYTPEWSPQTTVHRNETCHTATHTSLHTPTSPPSVSHCSAAGCDISLSPPQKKNIIIFLCFCQNVSLMCAN